MFAARQDVKAVHVEGRVIRADGRVEELGTLAYWHRNPLRRWAWRLGQLLRGRRGGQIRNTPQR